MSAIPQISNGTVNSLKGKLLGARRTVAAFAIMALGVVLPQSAFAQIMLPDFASATVADNNPTNVVGVFILGGNYIGGNVSNFTNTYYTNGAEGIGTNSYE